MRLGIVAKVYDATMIVEIGLTSTGSSQPQGFGKGKVEVNIRGKKV